MRRINPSTIKLTKQEQAIEAAVARGEYIVASKKTYKEIRRAFSKYRKKSVLNMRINNQDLSDLKRMAKKFGVKYQTFIADILHQVAIG
ncbi:MAG: hypothetical protein HYZ83_04860 [Candidatus Omnitrophica bacterium]|nr:hypothetical protein [Candidatus Omnitrophota bacterium]